MGDIFSTIISAGAVAFASYCVLYKCCEMLLAHKNVDFDELMKQFNVSGVARIILETFEVFGSKVRKFIAVAIETTNKGLRKGVMVEETAGDGIEEWDKDKIKRNLVVRAGDFWRSVVNVFLKRFFFQNNDKPIMKQDKEKDREMLFEYLTGLLDEKKEQHTTSFKDAVEDVWRDKWSYFAHSKYIGKMLDEIGDLCYENGLPVLSFLITYPDGTLATGSFQERWKEGENGWEKFGIKQGDKATCEAFKKYLELTIENREKYKKIKKEITK